MREEEERQERKRREKMKEKMKRERDERKYDFFVRKCFKTPKSAR